MVDRIATTERGSADRPIFVHSGFRAASTWLWAHFRACPAFLAYYEIFNEDLATLAPAEVGVKSSTSWRSHHPNSPPYFLEFIPLLKAEGGVEAFARTTPFGAGFVPIGGLDGELSAQEVSYVDGLIGAVKASGRIPVLTCTRSLGRIGAMRREFGGTHVLLRRNLFHQWNSFSGQHRTGNIYFVASMLFFIFNNTIDPFFSHLRSLLPNLGIDDMKSVIEADYDETFAIFAAWHLYLLIYAGRHADITIDVTRLADPTDSHRADVEQAIEAATGQRLSLDDVRNAIDLPWRPIADPEGARLKLAMLAERACVALAATAAERSTLTTMLDDLWREHERFTLYSAAAMESLAEATKASQAYADAAGKAEAERDLVAQRHADWTNSLQTALTEQTRLLETEREEADEARRAAEQRIARSRQAADDLTVSLESARSELNEANAESGRRIAQMEAEHRAEITKLAAETATLASLAEERRSEAERWHTIHAEESARLRDDLAQARTSGAASDRSIRLLLTERQRAVEALEALREQSARDARSASDAVARAKDDLADARAAAQADIEDLTAKLAAAESSSVEQCAALETILRERTIERVSRAELAAERDAALCDQAKLAEEQRMALVAELDSARRALGEATAENAAHVAAVAALHEELQVTTASLERLQRARAALFDRFQMEDGPVALRGALPLARFLSRLFHAHRRARGWFSRAKPGAAGEALDAAPPLTRSRNPD